MEVTLETNNRLGRKAREIADAVAASGLLNAETVRSEMVEVANGLYVTYKAVSDTVYGMLAGTPDVAPPIIDDFRDKLLVSE